MKRTEDMSVKEIQAWVKACTQEEQSSLAELLAKDARSGVRKMGEALRKREEKRLAETARLEKMWEIEDALHREGYEIVCGCDEVGRGPLAGPVVACAVILPREVRLAGLNDSKKLSAKRREELDTEIREKAAAYAIGEMSPRVIDAVNILEASRLAMVDAVKRLSIKADLALIDGWENPRFDLPQKAVVKGDSLCMSIAAASVVAKVYRDKLMEEMEEKYPGYGFAVNKGYGTQEHYRALKRLGPCAIHRVSFNLKLEEM